MHCKPGSFSFLYHHPSHPISNILQDEAANRWTAVSIIKLLGAGGSPKLTITPPEIDFRDSGLGIQKQHTIIFKNEGSAIVNYSIQPNWDWDSIIYFDPSTALEGKLEPEQEMPVVVCFKPGEHLEYVTEILVKTQVETKGIRVRGQGAEYKIYAQALPEVVDFGLVSFGGVETRKVSRQTIAMQDSQRGLESLMIIASLAHNNERLYICHTSPRNTIEAKAIRKGS